MTVLLPKVMSRTLEGVLDWADRIIVYFEQSIEAAQAAETPVGFIMDRASTAATSVDGWLLCNGGVVSQTSYPQLFAILGTTFNTGAEGAGNFRLPNATVTISGVAGCKRYIKHD